MLIDNPILFIFEAVYACVVDRKVYVALSAAVAVLAIFSATIFSEPSKSGISTVTIPFGMNDPYNPRVNETHLDPQYITVVVGENNTVRWVNKSVAKQWIVPQTMDDLAFYLIAPHDMAIVSGGPTTNLVPDDGSFEFTFTKPGVYPYTIGDQSGVVKVLSADGRIPAQIVDKPLYTIRIPYVARMMTSAGKIYATTGNYLYIIDSRTNAILTNVTSYGSFRMALDPATDKIYLINDETGDLYTLDGGTGGLVHSMNLGRPGAEINLLDVEVDGNNRIYVNYANSTARNSGILIIDGSTYKVQQNLIRAGPQSYWYQMAVGPKDGRIYVMGRSGDGSQIVTAIDGIARNVTDTTEIGDGAHDIAVNPATEIAYVATANDHDQRQAASSSLKVIDWMEDDTGRRIRTVTGAVVDAGVSAANPDYWAPSIAIDQKNDIVYVTNYLQRSVSAVDGSTGKVTGRIELDGNPTGVAVDQDTGRVYVSEQQAILIFDSKVARP